MLDAHAHPCLLASKFRLRKKKVNFGFCDGVAEQFYIAIAMSESGGVHKLFFMQTHERETAHGRIPEGGGQEVWKINKK